MRFSLKRILAAAVYVAVAAAAFSQPSWVYADILWALSLLAIVFAGLVAFLAQGRPPVAAAGFLLASVCFLAYVTAASAIGNNATPITRVLVAAGYEQFPPDLYYAAPITSPSPAVSATPLPSPANGTFTVTVPPPQAPAPMTPVVEFAQYVRAANAVGMMAFGLLGSLAGMLALRITAPARRDMRL